MYQYTQLNNVMQKCIQGRMFSLSLACQAWNDHPSRQVVIALKGGRPCRYYSSDELVVNALFRLSSYLWDLGCDQNVHLPLLQGGPLCILALRPPDQGEALSSEEEGRGLAVACDQGEELDLCDLEDDCVEVEAPQIAPLVRGEMVGDVELEGAAAVRLVGSFSGQLGWGV